MTTRPRPSKKRRRDDRLPYNAISPFPEDMAWKPQAP
jgi:hypothetical protein